MKSQLNARISEATRTKLDSLTTIYGTQAEAIAVAVDRLWQDHNKEHRTMKGRLYTELRSDGSMTNGIYAVTLENVDADPFPVDDLRFAHRGGKAKVGGGWQPLENADATAKGVFEREYGPIDWQ